MNVYCFDLALAGIEHSASGDMIGLGFRLVEDLWITVGYAADNYLGFDSAGNDFAKQNSGVFVELNVAFNELSFARWLGKGGE